MRVVEKRKHGVVFKKLTVGRGIEKRVNLPSRFQFSDHRDSHPPHLRGISATLFSLCHLVPWAGFFFSSHFSQVSQIIVIFTSSYVGRSLIFYWVSRSLRVWPRIHFLTKSYVRELGIHFVACLSLSPSRVRWVWYIDPRIQIWSRKWEGSLGLKI